MKIQEQLEGLYFYSFTSGSYDSYSFDGMYVSHNLVTESMWLETLDEWREERTRLSQLIPLKEVKFMDRKRMVRATDGPEADAFREFLVGGPERAFILKHGLVAVEETEDFHRD